MNSRLVFAICLSLLALAGYAIIAHLDKKIAAMGGYSCDLIGYLIQTVPILLAIYYWSLAC